MTVKKSLPEAEIASLQLKQWKVFKICLTVILSTFGCWLFLKGIIALLNLPIPATVIFILLSVHVFLAFFVYQLFNPAMQGIIPREQFRQLLKHALFISVTSEISALSLMGIICYLFTISFGGFLFFSPALFVIVLFFAMQKSIPEKYKALVKRRLWGNNSHMANAQNIHAAHDEYSEYMEPENLDPANPIGLTNPSSPNYINPHTEK